MLTPDTCIMRTLILCFVFLLPAVVSAQFSVRIQIDRLPQTPAANEIYVTGNFNNWNPGDAHYRLRQAGGKFSIELDSVQAGTYQFKFTRGNFETVETNADGSDIENRVVTIQSDTLLQYAVAGWKTGHIMKDTTHTASANVQIMDTAFLIPSLNRTRRIWLYLPQGYATSKKRYPVLYMHDGQNLFDVTTSFSGEWGVDETMDAMQANCIVVGIDNGGVRRINEYTVYDSPDFGKAEGRQYLDFIVTVLKPYIDRHYRTKRTRQSTFMAGSSMGGLISFYGGLFYPKIFGKLGIFSPSFWMTPLVYTDIKQLVKKSTHGSQQYFFYAGGAEGASTIPNMQQAETLMRTYGKVKTQVVTRPDGQHNETTWGREFAGFYKWLTQ